MRLVWLEGRFRERHSNIESLNTRDVTKFEFDNVRTSNVFYGFKI